MKRIVFVILGLALLTGSVVWGLLPADGMLSRISIGLVLLLWTICLSYVLLADDNLNTISLLILLSSYVICKAIQPPLPASLVALYVGFTLMALVVFISIENHRMASFFGRWQEFFAADRLRFLRLGAGAAVLGWVGIATYSWAMPTLEPPVALRVIHPAPPATIKVKGKNFDLASANNPFRHGGDLAKSIEEGKTLYYQNCFYCHGDTLDGKGHYAPAFNPFPANFQDVGTIAMLQESYVFWRVAKGGPGLPRESTPWSSAMPRWEDMMTEQEMWKVILYIYDGTGHSPRTWEETEIH